MKAFKHAAFILMLVLCLACATSCGNGQDVDNQAKHEDQGEYDNLEHTTPTDSKSDTTQAPTDAPTEALTEEATEEITTEKKPEPVLEKSLKFTSYGDGTCSVSGIGTIADMCVVIPTRSPAGDVVTAIDDMAFYGNKQIKAVQIPSTISSVGQRAFGACSSLVYISVDTNNKVFCDVDGVLYSKDMSTLMHYPAASGASSLELSVKVKKISDMAFYNCDTLTAIYYGGTLEDWGKIDIGEMNYGLFTASISCKGNGK